ncbi:MAG: triose-phosphate isomerase [Gammaproteobacteria bacterium]
MRTPLVVANWKMHGRAAALEAYVSGLASGLAEVGNVQCVVCPPLPYLRALGVQLGETVLGERVELGAQDCSAAAEDGAYTGEVAAAMLAEVGCRRVIVGHSERRQRQGETDAVVAAKFEAALAAGLAPVLCVGETEEQRQAGNAEACVGTQLDAVLKRVGGDRLALGAVAYEPIWAIGSGESATPAVAEYMHRMLRQRIAAQSDAAAETVCILYGGSVKPDNAAEFFAEPDIDGALVGGASLDPAAFCAIAAAARAV